MSASPGSVPAREFLSGLDKKMRAKLFRAITLLQADGNELREPDSKHLSEGIFELRAKIGSDISRVLCFWWWVDAPFLRMASSKRPTRPRPQK